MASKIYTITGTNPMTLLPLGGLVPTWIFAVDGTGTPIGSPPAITPVANASGKYEFTATLSSGQYLFGAINLETTITGSGGVGSANSFTVSGAGWASGIFVNWTLTDSVGSKFMITANTATVLTVSGTPASGTWSISIAPTPPTWNVDLSYDEVASVATTLGTPAGASVSADIASVKSDTTGILSSLSTLASSVSALPANVWAFLNTNITTSGSIGQFLLGLVSAVRTGISTDHGVGSYVTTAGVGSQVCLIMAVEALTLATLPGVRLDVYNSAQTLLMAQTYTLSNGTGITYLDPGSYVVQGVLTGYSFPAVPVTVTSPNVITPSTVSGTNLWPGRVFPGMGGRTV